MRRLPSMQALRAFEAAARLQSFLLASKELHLTPSAISHQVRALETYFGRLLFVRRSRQVELTAEGVRLLSQVSQAFNALEAACTELNPERRAQSLALHCVPSLASKWLSPRLPSFLKQYPDINLRLTASAEPVDLTKREDIDIIITYGEAPSGHGIAAEALGAEAIIPLATPAIAAQFDPSGMKALAHVTLIESAVSPVRWADWFAINRLPFSNSAAGPSFDRGALAVSAAAQGLGMALESTRFAQEELARGELVRVGGDCFLAVERELHFLCTRTAQRQRPKIAAFRKWLIAAAAAD